MAVNEALDEGLQFGPHNIPFAVVSTTQDPRPQATTRVFNQVYRFPDLIEKGLLKTLNKQTQLALQQPTLNSFAALGRTTHKEVRQLIQRHLLDQNPDFQDCAISINEIEMHLPVMVGDFSDFSCSRDHVLNAGEAVLGVRELPPGFLYFPVGYGGRCSSIMPPGSGVLRPSGQFRSPSGVSFGPSRAVDFELELACVIGQPSQYGKPVEINVAEEHIFGFLLLNDWSARDIQGLEMNPLGPFAGKSFGTSISPWIITPDALAPYRVAAPSKEIMLAPYLQHSSREGSYAIEMKAAIEAQGITTDVCKSQFQWLYWTMADMIAHQTINGCPLNAGDILATGTVSGNKEGTLGCLLEITKGGKQSLKLQEGIERIYLHDGGAVRLTATAGEVGSPEYVGFGSCYGMVLGQ